MYFHMGVPYILTPGFDEQIVRYALEKKIEVLPGSADTV